MQKTYTLIEFLEQNQDGYKLEDWEITWGTQAGWESAKEFKEFKKFWPIKIPMNLLFRKKVKTIVCNGFTIPVPETAKLKHEHTYFVPSVTNLYYYEQANSAYYESTNNAVERKIIHLTKENAIMHAKAMLGIDPHKPD